MWSFPSAQVLVAEAWVPSGARPRVAEALRAAAEASHNSGVNTVLQVCGRRCRHTMLWFCSCSQHGAVRTVGVWRRCRGRVGKHEGVQGGQQGWRTCLAAVLYCGTVLWPHLARRSSSNIPYALALPGP